MAKPIEIGLYLEGEDARRFDDYINNPDDDTKDGRKMMSDARKLAKKMMIDGFE